VGNHGLTLAESRAHFSLWCILAAPLMAGNDARHMTPEIRALMTDREALAIDQDPLGRQGWRFRAETGREIWVRELAGGDWAVVLLNSGAEPADLAIDFSHGWWFLPGECRIRDLWDKRDAGTTAQPFQKRIDAHDVAFLRLKRVN
jgi:alpha-galactosidase